MGVVFVVLGVLQVAIWGLGLTDRSLQATEPAQPAAPGAEIPETQTDSSATRAAALGVAFAIAERFPSTGLRPRKDRATRAAVIGVSLALADEEARSTYNSTSRAGEGSASGWVLAGRSRLMSTRSSTRRGGRTR